MKGTLYHIVRDREINVGDEIVAGEGYNHFAKRLFSADFQVEGVDINKLIFTKDLNHFTERESKMTRGYIYESCAIIRELILENYRLMYCPHLPSRLKCLYACQTLEQAQSWIPALERMAKSKSSVKIVELSVDGEIFSGDGDLMTRSTHAVFDKFDLAKRYWSGARAKNEILFVGRAKVVRIIDEK